MKRLIQINLEKVESIECHSERPVDAFRIVGKPTDIIVFSEFRRQFPFFWFWKSARGEWAVKYGSLGLDFSEGELNAMGYAIDEEKEVVYEKPHLTIRYVDRSEKIYFDNYDDALQEYFKINEVNQSFVHILTDEEFKEL